MGQCFLYGNAGAAGGLRIVSGSTAPANPKENTVWVKSDKAGKKYVFAADEPESPFEGLIWLRATPDGIITRADVYAEGAWARENAYMYLSGAWMQISSAVVYLYNAGDLCEEVSGGWTTAQWYGNKEFPGAVPRIANSETGLAVTYTGGSGIVHTTGNLSLDGIRKISAVISGNGSSNSALVVSTGSGAIGFPGNVKATKSLINGTAELDVSALSGKHYVGFKVEGGFTIKSIFMSY